MKKENKRDNLNQAILIMEIKRDTEFINLKEQFYDTYESFAPLYLLKSKLKEITGTAELKKGFGNIAIGIASGLLVRGLFFGATRNPLKKMAGIMIQSVVANFAATHSDKIKQVAENFIHAASSKFKSESSAFSKQDIYE
jgi:hypothetical protein